MNTYLSRTEKVLMTRTMLLSGLLEKSIEEYQKSRHTDTLFMRGLRTANTWLKKALDRRFEFLDRDAMKDFIRHVHHMDTIFIPNDKAKAEYDKLKEMQDSIHLSADTFAELYSAIIPYACAKCKRKQDFRKCKLREIFMRTGILPVDSTATTACQYDYQAAGVDLSEWARKSEEQGMELDELMKELVNR